FNLFHFRHGIWLPPPNSKSDTESRINQSQKINQFLKKLPREKILCGDFNLALNTQSVKILEEDMVNLIKKYQITATRNKFFPGEEKFADYTFVSNGINVKNFQVPDIEVSDHLPMILEFE
ncbi:MAG: endonuclease/exonuclease/phosphatase family protein, partial [Patescibacteria group bacterium]|nr:endonuclease/exonuclease/phosphatase family protein [Patescibacteria group bacterium]